MGDVVEKSLCVLAVHYVKDTHCNHNQNVTEKLAKVSN